MRRGGGALQPACHNDGMSDASHAGASHREMLSEMLSGDDPAPALWAAVNSGLMGEIVPEFPALRMEQNHRRRHKDVLAHTIAVVAMSPDEPVVRLAALFHDIGKPLTRRYSDGEVTFRHHEVVGRADHARAFDGFGVRR